MSWRPMRPDDLVETNLIADIVHPAYPEDPAVQADRLSLFPDGCWVAEHQGIIVGYCVAHAGKRQRPPALDSLLGVLPPEVDCLYMHDVALLPTARGTGLGKGIVPLMQDVARRHGFAVIALTSVNDSQDFWRACGFKQIAPDAYLAAKLATYDADAIYMEMAGF
ncbi:GNAT family N-acetyltransferase [Lacibacterium aquatile]|uniref:GNAT family N-acetyltransferase n=1 Tax=Lacibacterium aquatile TaxID=1168082 RepID=A0ABW5DV62_9PROT